GFLQPDRFDSYDLPHLLVAEGEWPARHRDVTAASEFAFGESISSDQHPPRGGGEIPLAFIDDGRAVITVIGWQGAARLARVDVKSGKVEPLTPDAREVLHGT